MANFVKQFHKNPLQLPFYFFGQKLWNSWYHKIGKKKKKKKKTLSFTTWFVRSFMAWFFFYVAFISFTYVGGDPQIYSN
jgi:hypothetical protein